MLPKLEGGLWHPYRRKWATERKHQPLTDVAAAGGFRDIREAAQLAVEFIRAARAYLNEADADHRTCGAPIARGKVMGGGTIDQPED